MNTGYSDFICLSKLWHAFFLFVGRTGYMPCGEITGLIPVCSCISYRILQNLNQFYLISKQLSAESSLLSIRGCYSVNFQLNCTYHILWGKHPRRSKCPPPRCLRKVIFKLFCRNIFADFDQEIVAGYLTRLKSLLCARKILCALVKIMCAL